MKSQVVSRFGSRLVASGLLATQAFLGTVAVQELSLMDTSLKPGYAAQAEDNVDAAQVYEKSKDAIVYIETDQGQGSGVIIRSDGLIATNAHVVRGATKVVVELSNGRRIKAEVVSEGDPNCIDLALLRLPNQQNLPSIKIVPFQSIKPGQSAFAMGFPIGIKPVSITNGIVSNLNSQDGTLQLNVALNPGNSGGALLNNRGELVGINTRGRTDATLINYAVTTDRLQAVIQAFQNQLSPATSYVLDLNSGNATQLVVDRPKVEGKLQSSDQKLCRDGSMADIYTLQGQANQQVSFEMTSRSLKPSMLLLGPDGQRVTMASGQNAGVSRWYGVLPMQGNYTVIANTERANQFGDYSLQAVTPIMVRLRENLGNGDPICMKDGSPCRNYSFHGKAGQVSLSLGANGFKPYVMILDSQGTVVWKDVWPGGSHNIKLEKDDRYRLVVSTVQAEEGGSFSLAIRQETLPTPKVAQK
jgi:serine protease Do